MTTACVPPDRPLRIGARPFAIVTAAAAGLGRDLALCCAEAGFDLLLAADAPGIDQVAEECRDLGARVEALEADLATEDGVNRLCAALADRPVDALLALAGPGPGPGFLDQDAAALRQRLDADIAGTLRLVQHVGRGMRVQRQGCILLGGSPGAGQPVEVATQAFLGTFAGALRQELAAAGISVTCLRPGAGGSAALARDGVAAMLRGDAEAACGLLAGPGLPGGALPLPDPPHQRPKGLWKPIV